MFDFGYGELLIIGIAALIFIGPKELPGVLRAAGQWMAKIRRMAGEFQNQFQEAMREAELADLKKEVDDMAAQAANYSNLDPLAEVRKEMASAQHDIETSLAEKSANGPASDAASAPQPAPPSPDAVPAQPAGIATEPVQEEVKDQVKEPVTHGAGGSDPA